MPRQSFQLQLLFRFWRTRTIFTGSRKTQRLGLPLFLERRFARFDRSKNPAGMSLAGLQANDVVRRLIEKYPEVLRCLPTTVPTSVRFGRCGRPEGPPPLVVASTFGGAITAGASGRRDGEKIGRSRVIASEPSGIAQSGLPDRTRSLAAGAGVLSKLMTPRSASDFISSGDVAASVAFCTGANNAKPSHDCQEVTPAHHFVPFH